MEDELRSAFASDNLILTLTRKEASSYEKGRVDDKFLKKHIDKFSQNFYICGPKAMMGDLKETLSSLGASIDSVVFEQ